MIVFFIVHEMIQFSPFSLLSSSGVSLIMLCHQPEAAPASAGYSLRRAQNRPICQQKVGTPITDDNYQTHLLLWRIH